MEASPPSLGGSKINHSQLIPLLMLLCRQWYNALHVVFLALIPGGHFCIHQLKTCTNFILQVTHVQRPGNESPAK